MRALVQLISIGLVACAHQPPAQTSVYLPCATTPTTASPLVVHAEQAFELANRKVQEINRSDIPVSSLQAARQLQENATRARDVAVAHPRSRKAAAQAVAAASVLDHFIEIVKRKGAQK